MRERQERKGLRLQDSTCKGEGEEGPRGVQGAEMARVKGRWEGRGTEWVHGVGRERGGWGESINRGRRWGSESRGGIVVVADSGMVVAGEGMLWLQGQRQGSRAKSKVVVAECVSWWG